MEPSEMELILFSISMDREKYIISVPAGAEFDPARDLEITVSNIGNQSLNNLNIVVSGENKDKFSVSDNNIPRLGPKESMTFTISFPQTSQGAGIYKANVLVGNQNAARKLSLEYKEFTFIPVSSPVISLDEPLLQKDTAGHISTIIRTLDAEKTPEKLWFSSDTSKLAVDGESGVLTVQDAGECIIGFTASSDPFVVKGKKVRVYEAPQTVNPEYPLISKVLARPAAGKALPKNLAAIQALAEGDIVFTYTNGTGVIGSIEPASGLLTFAGQMGATTPITVDLCLKKDVDEGLLVTHTGTVTFNASIGAAPPANVLYATTVPDTGFNDDPRATVVDLLFDDIIAAGADPKDGFEIKKGAETLTIQSAIIMNDSVLQFTLDPGSAIKYGSTIEITYTRISGNITSNLTPVENFTQQVTNTVEDEKIKPWIVNADIQNSTRDKLHVVFSEPVTIDSAGLDKLKVKVNNMPSGNAVPYMENGVSQRNIIAALPVGGTGDREWELTMSAPAAFGEILRLATTTTGAVTDKSSNLNGLPAVPQFIVRSLVERTKGTFENTPGLYRNSNPVGAVTADANLLNNALTHIDAAANRTSGDVFTIVLGQNQSNYNPTTIFAGLDYGSLTVIITSDSSTDWIIPWAATGKNLTARNGVTIVISEHVVLQGFAGNNQELIRAMDGGKIILDGGEIRDNTCTKTTDYAAGVRIGGGTNGAFFLMNSGKISGNTMVANGSGAFGGGGAVSLSDYSVFVMHGGEISGNAARGTAVTLAKAGAIATRNNGTDRQNMAIYITGGEIKNNTVEPGSTGAGAGGIFANSVFQKTGGIIHGSDSADANTSDATGTVSVAAIAVVGLSKTANQNPASGDAVTFDLSAGEDTHLFVEMDVGSNRTLPTWGGANPWVK
jgi:hypothetical protein